MDDLVIEYTNRCPECRLYVVDAQMNPFSGQDMCIVEKRQSIDRYTLILVLHLIMRLASCMNDYCARYDIKCFQRWKKPEVTIWLNLARAAKEETREAF